MKNIITVFIAIIAFLILYYLICKLCNRKDLFTEIISVPKISYKVNPCMFVFPENIKKVFDKYNIKPYVNDNSEMIIYIPCTYDLPKKEIDEMQLRNNFNDKIFIINNCDNIVAKEFLWKNIVQHYGQVKALQYIPDTYIIYNNNDVKRFKENHKDGNLYILKKNVQRQEGLKITDDANYIAENKDGYNIAQTLLQDPYLVNGRKINLRVYILVVCHKEDYRVYVYDDGFMYYTKELFKYGSKDFAHHVTTGYVDRQVYEENPLTHKDFKKYLDSPREITPIEKKVLRNNQKISSYVFGNIRKLIKDIFTAFHKKIGNTDANEKLYNYTSFQLFGADVAIDDKLNAKIMEINKGPDINSKDKRDGDLKLDMLESIFKTVGVIDNTGNNFKEVLRIPPQ